MFSIEVRFRNRRIIIPFKIAIRTLHFIGIIFILKSSLVAQLVKNLPAMWETWVQSLGLEESPGEGKVYPLQYSWVSPCGSAGKESACNVGDLDSILGLGRYPGEGKG